MTRDHTLFIKDIIDAIEKISEFVAGMEYDEFVQDDKTLSAVVRKVEIIGEATRNIPKEIKATYSDIPWRDIVGMRNKIIHDYFGIDNEIVWQVIKEKLPALRNQIEKVLKDLQAKK